MAAQSQGGTAANVDLFDAYFTRADLDRDGRISGAEAVAFLKGSNLPQRVLAQIWTYAEKNQQGYLGKVEFYNALKLITVAQSNRELTPDIVKAALYSPASARIPAPKINFSSISPLQPNAVGATPSASQMGSAAASPQNPALRGLPASPSIANKPQLFNQSQVNASTGPLHGVSGVAAYPVQTVGVHGTPVGGSAMAPSVPNSGIQNGTVFESTTGAPISMVSQSPNRGNSVLTVQAGSDYRAYGSMTSLAPRPPATSGTTQSVDLKSSVSQNGFASDSLFGGNTFSATQSQPKQDNSSGTQLLAKQGSLDFSQNSPTVQPADGQLQRTQSLPNQNQPATIPDKASLDLSQSSLTVHPVAIQLHRMQSDLNQNQHATVQNTSTAPGISTQHSAANQSQMQWPKMTESDVQKYTKVFMVVDTDRDGRITGVQARNLFLSWRLPREVLKQVWDLADEDNDSMLSLREFCVALYLMERYREGHPLPKVLPRNIVLDFPMSLPSTSGYSNAALGHSIGSQHQQPMPGSNARQIPRAAGKPPLPTPAAPSNDRLQSKQQKANSPVLEEHLVDQLSEQEQKSLNTKFQVATEANKKVEELEKEIKESRERMEFYRAKMQELVLYKSRCDSRLNEIMGRAAADKCEVESLAKKYEEKYREVGDVASKLTIEEATFRDIQERKMELYQTIVKMEQESNTDDSLQVRADRIQSNLEQLVKSLSERCKKYGLRGKPTTLLELPFGWQPGIQEGAADWDEDWDKFEDEGFSFVKELTLDVLNVVAPPKPKAKTAKKGNFMAEDENAAASSDAEAKEENPAAVAERAAVEVTSEKYATVVEHVAENGSANDDTEDGSARSPTGSPVGRSSHENAHDEVTDYHVVKTVNSDALPHATELKSHRGAESSFFGDKTLDEPIRAFDTNDDVDSVWGFSTASTSKGFNHEGGKHDDLFGPWGLSLNPIKTGSAYADSNFQRKGKGPSIFADSVSGTPKTETKIQRSGPSIFADSVPSTPYTESNFQRGGSSVFVDSVPSTPFAESNFHRRDSSIFADSVPSTPLDSSNYSPRRNNDGPEEQVFNFSRFDSFQSTDTGFQHRETLARFDSMQSRTGFDYGNRFPSFDDSDRFGSGFDETPRRDSDPFGSSVPYRSFGSETPRTDGHWGSLGLFNTSFDSKTPRRDPDSLSFDEPFRSSLGSETPRTEGPFGGPFRSSLGSETPRTDFDPFRYSGPLRSSLGSETPREGSDAFGSSGPWNSTFTSETPRGGTSNWSAF
ncbi:hypothetical protein Ancab_028213 [Ancistrocladus abbreviatus]